jgi:hypothetical protein
MLISKVVTRSSDSGKEAFIWPEGPSMAARATGPAKIFVRKEKNKKNKQAEGFPTLLYFN